MSQNILIVVAVFVFSVCVLFGLLSGCEGPERIEPDMEYVVTSVEEPEIQSYEQIEKDSVCRRYNFELAGVNGRIQVAVEKKHGGRFAWDKSVNLELIARRLHKTNLLLQMVSLGCPVNPVTEFGKS